MKTEVQKAVRLAGSREALAHMARVTGETVDRWVEQGGMPRTAARLVELETKGGVTEAKLVKDDRVKK